MGNLNNFATILSEAPPQENFCANILYFVLERSSQSNSMASKTVSLGQFYNSLSMTVFKQPMLMAKVSQSLSSISPKDSYHALPTQLSNFFLLVREKDLELCKRGGYVAMLMRYANVERT